MDSLVSQLTAEYTLLMDILPRPEVTEKVPRALCAVIKAVPGSSAPRSQVKNRVRTALFDETAQCLVVKQVIGGKIFPGHYPISKLDAIVDSFY